MEMNFTYYYFCTTEDCGYNQAVHLKDGEKVYHCLSCFNIEARESQDEFSLECQGCGHSEKLQGDVDFGKERSCSHCHLTGHVGLEENALFVLHQQETELQMCSKCKRSPLVPSPEFVQCPFCFEGMKVKMSNFWEDKEKAKEKAISEERATIGSFGESHTTASDEKETKENDYTEDESYARLMAMMENYDASRKKEHEGEQVVDEDAFIFEEGIINGEGFQFPDTTHFYKQEKSNDTQDDTEQAVQYARLLSAISAFEQTYNQQSPLSSHNEKEPTDNLQEMERAERQLQSLMARYEDQNEVASEPIATPENKEQDKQQKIPEKPKQPWYTKIRNFFFKKR